MTTVNRFSHFQTMQEATQEYKRIIFVIHPDRRPINESEIATRETQELNAEFAQFAANFANNEARERQNAAHNEGKKSAADFHDINTVTEILRQKIESVLNMGLDVELCGLWLWVTGNTREHKEELKAIDFKWNSKKLAWFYAGVPSFNRNPKTLDEIRQIYGSTKYTVKQDSLVTV